MPPRVTRAAAARAAAAAARAAAEAAVAVHEDAGDSTNVPMPVPTPKPLPIPAIPVTPAGQLTPNVLALRNLLIHSSESVTPEVFQTLTGQAQPPVQTPASGEDDTPRPVRPESSERFVKVEFKDFENFDLADPKKIEPWLMDFEACLQSMDVPEARWVQRFLVCDKVSREDRTRIQQEFAPTTSSTWADFLAYVRGKYGPRFYLWKIERDMIEAKAEIILLLHKRLIDLLGLYNRVAAASGQALKSADSIALHFTAVLPFAISEQATRYLQSLPGDDNIFERLYAFALECDIDRKSAPTYALTEDIAYMHTNSTSRKRAPLPNRYQAKRSRLKQPLATGSNRATTPFPLYPNRGSCKNCGRTHALRSCPAYNDTCTGCKRKGHWVAMCRSSGQSQQRTSA